MRKSQSISEKSTASKEGMLLGGFFEDAFFQFLLAFNTVPRPGNGLQPFRVDFAAARNALAEITLADAGQGGFNPLQQAAVGIALVEKEFLVIGTRRLVPDVLRRILVSAPPVLLSARNHTPQLLLPRFQTLLKYFKLLLIHLLFQTATRTAACAGRKLNRNDMRLK